MTRSPNWALTCAVASAPWEARVSLALPRRVGLAWVQRRVKYGLAEPAEVEFFEAGFADRIVAAALAERFPEVASRRDVRQVMRSQIEPMAAVLTHFPAYPVSRTETRTID